jgi:hypothetical protein
MIRTSCFLFAAALAVGCADTTEPTELNDQEVITTVVLTLTPSAGGEALEFRWADPENDGSPVVDDVELVAGESYDLAVSFLNELEDPPEDITGEVAAEGEEHQVFFTGTALDNGLIAHTYADQDGSGFPIGLDSVLTADASGSGELVVTLRHLPPEDGVAVKTGSLADDLAAGGMAGLPGDTDAEVSFEVVVQ